MKQSNIILTSACGIVGTIALTLYFSAPFNWLPLPPPNATAAQIFAFGTKYHGAILLDTWLQQLGTVLSVVFALGLLQLAGTSMTLAGRLTLLTAAVITSLSLAEGTFVLGAVQAGGNGRMEASATCFELANVFIHIFLLAPSLFLMLGLGLKGTSILPKVFIVTAIALGVLFQSLGVIALFDNRFLLLVVGVLMLQNLWTIAASVTLLARRKT
ncbi:MAG TPA: hypothetical protein VNV85_15725 [Puia sp.]|jgi:hypothetical protein|nr:hypothetical protein [Puia sp.]